jgi:hypothetical protein
VEMRLDARRTVDDRHETPANLSPLEISAPAP